MLKFFHNHPEILAVMSERVDGSMKLFPGTEENLENRQQFFEKIGILKNQVVSAEIVHGNKIEVIDSLDTKIVSGADGLATQKPGIFLSITVADCIPVFFYEPEKKIVAIAHAGWRGILNSVIPASLEKIKELGGNLESLKIALGPSIDKRHFEIQEDSLGRFEKYPQFIEKRKGRIFVDLKGIIQEQLIEAGMRSEKIINYSECTFENPERYFSYRRDKPKKVEAMLATIGIL